MSERRILVTGGSGFLGSHLCDRLVARGDDVVCADNLFTGRKRNVAHLLGHAQLRVPAPRRDVSALCRGRPDLQSRLPGLAHPLPARSGADDQDQRARRHQHAGAGQAPARRASSRPRPRKCTAIPTCIRSRRSIGAASIRSACAPATTKANAAPRPCSSTIIASTSSTSASARIFNTYGPRMHPNDGRVVSNFIVQALQGPGHHALWRRRADALVLLCRRSDRRLHRLHGQGRRSAGPDQSRQSQRVHHQAAGRDGDRAHRLEIEARVPPAAQRRSQAAPARHRQGARSCSAGSRKCSCATGCTRTIAYFDGLLREGRCETPRPSRMREMSP